MLHLSNFFRTLALTKNVNERFSMPLRSVSMETKNSQRVLKIGKQVLLMSNFVIMPKTQIHTPSKPLNFNTSKYHISTYFFTFLRLSSPFLHLLHLSIFQNRKQYQKSPISKISNIKYLSNIKTNISHPKYLSSPISNSSRNPQVNGESYFR